MTDPCTITLMLFKIAGDHNHKILSSYRSDIQVVVITNSEILLIPKPDVGDRSNLLLHDSDHARVADEYAGGSRSQVLNNVIFSNL